MAEHNKGEYDASPPASTLRDGLLFFGIGATIGAALALLFAPKSGFELRSDIADAGRKGYDATLEKAMDLKDQSQAAVVAVKEKADAIIDFAGAKISSGTDIVADVISATTGAVNDGIERMENESGAPVETRTSGRRPSNIM